MAHRELTTQRTQASELPAALAAARAHYGKDRHGDEEARELLVGLTQLYRHYLAQEDRLFFRPHVGLLSDRQPGPTPTGPHQV